MILLVLTMSCNVYVITYWGCLACGPLAQDAVLHVSQDHGAQHAHAHQRARCAVHGVRALRGPVGSMAHVQSMPTHC